LKFVVESIGLTVAGGKELALDLMASLAGHRQHQFTFVLRDSSPYEAISSSNIRKVICNNSSGLLQRALLLNYQIPNICREEGADALLCLGNFPPRKPSCPTVVLLQNARMVYRDPVAESRLTTREKLIIAYGRHAYRNLPSDITLITQTQVMKDHLCGPYGIDRGRVAIIPNAFCFRDSEDNGNLSRPKRDEGATAFTFLCLAHYYAHKNIDIILEAAERLPKYTEKLANCIITIAPHQHPGARKLLAKLQSTKHNGPVKNIGPVPNHMLAEVYRNADALIFPTLLESYSRTYLEAMHFGLPILTSDRDFAHHVCHDAAIYSDPLDPDSVARAMARVMEDQELRERLVENGRRILARAPTWEEIAARFVEVLERAAQQRHTSVSTARSKTRPELEVNS